MATHYTAVLSIEKVDEHDGSGRGDDKRLVSDSVKVVIRAETMDDLKVKLAGHIGLL